MAAAITRPERTEDVMSWLLKEMLAKGFFPLIFWPKYGPLFQLTQCGERPLGGGTIFFPGRARSTRAKAVAPSSAGTQGAAHSRDGFRPECLLEVLVEVIRETFDDAISTCRAERLKNGRIL